MSRSARLLEILTAAGLADSELERERIKAQRDASLAQTWSGALSKSIESSVKTGGDVYKGAVDDSRASGADKALSRSGQPGDPYRPDERPQEGPHTEEETKAFEEARLAQLPHVTPDETQALKPNVGIDADLPAGPTPRAAPMPPRAKPAEAMLAPPTRAPYAPLKWQRPLGEEVDRAVAADADYKPVEGFMGLFQNGPREEGAKAYRRALAPQIQAARVAAQQQQDAADKRSYDAANEAWKQKLEAAKYNQTEDHFSRSEVSKQKLGESDHDFEMRKLGAAQAFAAAQQARAQAAAAAEGEKNRKSREGIAGAAAQAALAKINAKAAVLPPDVRKNFKSLGDAVANTALAHDLLAEIQGEHGADTVGYLRSRVQKLQAGLGIDDAKVTRFYQAFTKAKTSFAHETFGSAVTKYEGELLGQSMGDVGDDDAAMMTRLGGSLADSLRAYDDAVDTYRQSLAPGAIPDDMNAADVLKRTRANAKKYESGVPSAAETDTFGGL